MKNIITGITQQLKAVTEKVYYLHLPDESFLKEHSIVFTLFNGTNEDVFEQKELLKTYDLIIRINSAKLSTKQIGGDELQRVLNLVQPIKNGIYGMAYNCISLVDEDNFFDNDLDIYTYVLRYELIVSFD